MTPTPIPATSLAVKVSTLLIESQVRSGLEIQELHTSL